MTMERRVTGVSISSKAWLGSLGLVVLLRGLWPGTPVQTPKCTSLAASVEAHGSEASTTVVGVAQRLLASCKSDFAALFRAGRALNRVIAFGGGREQMRLPDQAERLLARAVVLRPKHAVAWLEYGTLLQKRGGAPIDARRAIERALAIAEEYPDSTPPDLLAEMYFRQAQQLQHWLDRLRGLRDGARLGVFAPTCSQVGIFCENYVAPQRFNDQLRDLPTIDPDFRGRRERVLGLYERSVNLDAHLWAAVVSYARELALGEDWLELASLAKRLTPQSRDSAMLQAVAALAEERLGHYQQADSLFRLALRGLPDSVRGWFTRPPTGLDTLTDFWLRIRPLWITAVNEAELEYWSRTTFALVALGDREAGVRGPETPQGEALRRYGWPKMVTQVERDASRILTGAQLDAANLFLSCTPADVSRNPLEAGAACESREGYAVDVSGGRWVFWTYAMDQASLVFELRPGMRVPRYVRNAPAEEHAAQLREKTPMTFESRIAPKEFRVPIQMARFRGESLDQTVVALYSLVPAKLMDLPAEDSLATGLFVFRQSTGFPLLVEQRATAVPGEALALNYRLPLGSGRYAYSLEAFAPARGVAGTARDSLVAPTWGPDSLQLSDLLIAHRVEAPKDSEPRTWRDLVIEPSRTLEVQKGVSLWAVWETYGLRAGLEGTARYRVNLALRDRNARSAPLRLLERLGVGRRQGTPAVALEGTAERRLAADGRALEYVAVQLPEDATGTYELVVTVSDPATGRSAKTHRTIAITDASP